MHICVPQAAVCRKTEEGTKCHHLFCCINKQQLGCHCYRKYWEWCLQVLYRYVHSKINMNAEMEHIYLKI
jgi:hypothetical protein